MRILVQRLIRGSHLIGELTSIVESNGNTWAGDIKRLLKEACVEMSKSKQKKLSDEDANMQKRFRTIIMRGGEG